MHGQAGEVALLEQDAAAIGPDEADDDVETGGLAGPVRAQQADDLTAGHAEGDIDDDLASLVALGQVECAQFRHGRLSRRPGRAGEPRAAAPSRSEERRVGEGCSGWSAPV